MQYHVSFLSMLNFLFMSSQKGLKLIRSIFLFGWIFCVGNVNLIAQKSTESLSYTPSIVLPDETADIKNMSDILVDNAGYVWITSASGLHCYDGQKLVTYNNNFSSGNFQIGQLGTGYYRMFTTDGWHIWLQEIEMNSWICIDTRTRKVTKSIQSNIQEINNLAGAEKGGALYRLYENPDQENEYILECLSCSSVEKRTLQDLPEIIDYKIFDNSHWLISKTHVIYRIPIGGIEIDTFEMPRKFQFSDNISDSLYFIQEKHVVFNNEQNLLLPVDNQLFELDVKYMDILQKGSHLWFLHPNRNLFFYNRSSNIFEDYTSTISELQEKVAPRAISYDFHKGVKLDNGIYIFISAVAIYQFTPNFASELFFKEDIESNGIRNLSMRGVTEDDESNIYASYYTGVAVKNEKEEGFKPFRDTNDPKKSNDGTYGLTYWNNHLIWNTIIFDLESKEKDFFITPNYGFTVPHCIVKDSLWYYYYPSFRFGKYNLQERENTILVENFLGGDEFVSTIEHDSISHTFYISTSRKGIFHVDYEGRILHEYDTENLGLSHPHYFIYDLELVEDSLWFGFELGIGVIALKSGQINLFHNPYLGKEGQLLQRSVFSILKESADEFLLGSSRGIVLFNKSNYTFKNLVNNHPLAEKEFNRCSEFKSSKGRYYFGTVSGLYSFEEDELVFKNDDIITNPPLIYNISVYDHQQQKSRAFDNIYSLDYKLPLKYSESNIEIDFSIPSIGESIYYSYKIDGISDEWSSYSKDGHIEVLSFPPGHHKLMIRASNNVTSEVFSVITLDVIKDDLWYKKWWVILLFIMAISGLVFTVLNWRYRQKLAQRKAMENLRVKLSSDLHDDVGTLLSSIAIHSDVMAYEVKDIESKKTLKNIGQTSKEAIEKMRDIVWAIDSRKDKYGNLIDRMRSYIEHHLEKTHISHNFEIVGIDKLSFINPEVRQNIYLIFKEVINNVTKHANATHIEIKFAKQKNTIDLIIQDNGKSTNQHSSDGQGLANITMRAEKIGGSIDIDKKNGWKVKLTLPH